MEGIFPPPHAYLLDGRRSQTTLPTGKTETYSYDPLVRLSESGVDGVLSSSYTYESPGEDRTTSLVKTVNNSGLGEIGYTYDAVGNITQITKDGAVQESYTYDSLNQLKTVTRGGVTTEYSYQNGNITSVTQNGETVKTYGYTDSTWSDLLTSFNGQTITYDEIGNPLQYRDGMSFTWDNGRQLQSVTKNGAATSYTYDANNNALLSVSAGGMTNSYAYSDDRLQTITVNSSLQYALAYDVLGRTTSTKVGNGTSWRTLSSLSYNSAGLLAKQTYGNGDYIDFTYDSLDRITEKRYNGSDTKRATYAYGADGSLARTTDFSTGTTTRYVYDLADRLVSVREYDGTSVTSNALRASTDYIYADKTNYLTGMRHFSPLGTQTVDYTYGDVTAGQMPDQVYSVKWNGEEKLSYTYDPLGRLSTRTLHVTGNVENIPQLTTQYSYVNVGEDRTTTMVQSVSTMGVTHNYTYDAVGNIQSIQLGSDVTSYEYDSLNQLVRVNDPYLNRTITYEYENGNITFEHTYAYTTGDLPATPMYSTQYHYNDPVWRLWISYNTASSFLSKSRIDFVFPLFYTFFRGYRVRLLAACSHGEIYAKL